MLPELAAILRKGIQAEEFTGRIPSILTLAQQYGVSHRTIGWISS